MVKKHLVRGLAAIRASRNRDHDTVSFLIEEGANINATDSSGQTAVIAATLRRAFDLVSFFVERDADLTVRDSQGKTALM
jgi:ankyrin repeat protein